MKLIKLNAIDSTNTYLKNLCRANEIENFTVVTAESQTDGRGQMGAKWETVTGKNLLMSVLFRNEWQDFSELFVLNVAVAICVYDVLLEMEIPNLSVKWPNDIMAENKKIAGILIENVLKTDKKVESIIGIGLNVNQTSFANLPKASSLQLLTNKEFDVDTLAIKITEKIEMVCKNLQPEVLWKNYHKILYKLMQPVAFETADKNQFMGIIQGVTQDGKLKVLLENDEVKTFAVKEIAML